MQNYSSVILVKIEQERVVTVDGEEFLIVDSNAFNTMKANRIARPYQITDQLQQAIVDILKDTPGLRNSQIREMLDRIYDMQPANNVMRGCLQRMRDGGHIRVEGEKNKAVWFAV